MFEPMIKPTAVERSPIDLPERLWHGSKIARHATG
jgi:hypothetical protein